MSNPPENQPVPKNSQLEYDLMLDLLISKQMLKATTKDSDLYKFHQQRVIYLTTLLSIDTPPKEEVE
jgi:hypothetical protein